MVIKHTERRVAIALLGSWTACSDMPQNQQQACIIDQLALDSSVSGHHNK